MRGRRGTEWAAGTHQPGEPFALIQSETLAPLELPLSIIGSPVELLASGIGDEEPVSCGRIVTGESVRPPAPVHLAGEAEADGGLTITWVRRSRQGWTWLDGADAPLAEEGEAYRLTLAATGFTRSVNLASSAYSYSAAERAADGWTGALTIEVVQLGTFAASRPARITID